MRPAKNKLLLVEDDANLRFVVKDNLEMQGYAVLDAENGEEGLQFFKEHSPDLCILDVMLPKMDGFTLAGKIRAENPQVPIIFLTARNMKDDRLAGFKVGGDDYITKPFSIEELIFRVQVFLRRSGLAPATSATQFKLAGIQFSMSEFLLKVNGQKHSLTQKEAELMELFMKNTNQVLKREDILNKIWGTDDYFKGRSLDVFISRLRKMIADEPLVDIQTIHGTGFKFCLKESRT
jgi:DNA-binding response OmpR family regulator